MNRISRLHLEVCSENLGIPNLHENLRTGDEKFKSNTVKSSTARTWQYSQKKIEVHNILNACAGSSTCLGL
jgi:hypothetical protein